MDPAQFIYQGDDKEVLVVDIPEKYIISYFSYDEIGQPMRIGRLRRTIYYKCCLNLNILPPLIYFLKAY